MEKFGFSFVPVKVKRTSRKKDALPLLKVREGRIDLIMLCSVLLLAAFGSVMVFSASTAYASIRFNDAYYFVRRQLFFVLLGIPVMLLSSRISLQKLRKYAPHLYGVTLFLLLLVPFLGVEAGGARRWIALGPLTFQPSELGKTALVMILAHYFSSDRILEVISQKKRGHIRYGILYPLLFMVTLCLFVLPEKHLSCIIILGLLGISLIFLAGGSGKVLGTMCALGGSSVALFAMAVEYTRRRITIWLNPALYPTEGGWQTLQGLMAIGSGGLFGLGLGQSRLKHLYVSEPQNDFIFTIVCEELGFIGALSVIALFVLFVWRGTQIAAAHPDRFSSLLAMGLTLKVALQALLNICVVTNTLPNTGISLPFFSYGGSSLIMLFAEMGLILSASVNSHIKQ